MNYENLLEEARSNKVTVHEKYKFQSEHIRGLYCANHIALSNHIETVAEKSCVLAEELGHHYTSSGNIIDLHDVQNRKQELRARFWAYNHKIGLLGIVTAYEYGCRNLHEMAEYLDVTKEFLTDALECYRKKYGVYTTIDNYIIYFEPNLTIAKFMR